MSILEKSCYLSPHSNSEKSKVKFDSCGKFYASISPPLQKCRDFDTKGEDR